MKPLYYSSVSSKGAGRPHLTHHHKGGLNETKCIRWVWRNGGMKFVIGENGRNPVKNLPRPRFVHHETHMEGPRRELGTPAVGGERLTWLLTFLFFYGEGLLVLQLLPKLEGHPLLTVCNCLFNIFAATLHIWRPSICSACPGMDRTCSAYGRIWKCTQNFSGKAWGKRPLGRPQRRWEDAKNWMDFA